MEDLQSLVSRLNEACMQNDNDEWDYFNENENDDGLSDDLKTADLGPKSLKLLLSQLRLTCIELKVALKLQGTNFLLHINQLKKKHDALFNEVASMKRIIDQNISQYTFPEANGDSNTTSLNGLCETGDFNNTTTPNVLNATGDFNNTTSPNAFRQTVDVFTRNSPEIINALLNDNESAQSNINAENLESQCLVDDIACQIVDCIEETMNTRKHAPHTERINVVLRNQALNALKGIIIESYKNNKESETSAVGNMFDVVRPYNIQIDAENEIVNAYEHVSENVAIQQASNCSPSVTVQCGLSSQVTVQHDPKPHVVVQQGCEPHVALQCSPDPSIDPHVTEQCGDDSNVTLQDKHEPRIAEHRHSDSHVHAKNKSKIARKLENCNRRREKPSFANIRKHIANHLVNTVGEGVTIAKLYKIMRNNHDSIFTGNEKENVKIIQICMRANDEVSAITIERNMLPDVFLDDSERYYKVVFVNKPRNGKASTTELSDDSSHSSNLKGNNVISGNKAPIILNDGDNDSPCNFLSNDVVLTYKIDDEVTPNPIIPATKGHISPKPSLKRKSNLGTEESKKNRKSNSLSSSNSSINSSPLILICDDSVESVRNANQAQKNPSTSTKPVILSNKVVKGDHVKSVFSLLEKEITGTPMKEKITQKSPVEQTSSQQSIIRKAKTVVRVFAADAIENIVELDLTDSSSSQYTRTNRSYGNYANNSTQQSFESLMQQSSFDSRREMVASSVYQRVNSVTKNNKNKNKGIYVRTQKKQLSTIPVTIREHLTWDVDDDDREIVIIPALNRDDDDDDDVEIIENDNTPIELD